MIDPFLYPLIFLVAAMYSSVGHGGASGYLAVLSLFGFSPQAMAPGALLLNLVVAGTAFEAYRRAGHFSARLFWPFAATSIPMAFFGGFLSLPAKIYGWLLMITLVFAAFRLALAGIKKDADATLRPLPLETALPIGGAIGLLSGLVGVGGGIFLSPLMILTRWANAKQTAAVSACFIWVNSLAGLYGHIMGKGLPDTNFLPLVSSAFMGGLLGSQLGARRFPHIILRRVLAGVLTIAAYKMLVLATSG